MAPAGDSRAASPSSGAGVESAPISADVGGAAAEEAAEPVPALDPSAIKCINKTGLMANTTQLETLDELDPPRQFYVHVPPGYDGMTGVPVVLDFHGLGGSADIIVDGHPGSQAGSQAAISGWRAKGDLENFITVHPVGLDASWNGGDLCCPPANVIKTDDEGFARAIVKWLAARGCIDNSRVYATGIGNGGALAHLLACRASDVFAAAAPISMGNGTKDCDPARPISIVLFRGIDDRTVPYHGGVFPSAMADFAQWRDFNGCVGKPELSHNDRCATYAQCRGGVRVTLCSPEAGNVLYLDAAQQGIAVSDIAWDIFKARRY